MKNILILTSTYLPNAGANGLITESIVKVLKQKGFSISIISIMSDDDESDYDIINGVEIFRVQKSKYSKFLANRTNDHNLLNMFKNQFQLIKRRFFNLINIYKFPDFDNKQTNQIISLTRKIVNEKKIDIVMAVNKPYSNISALINIKKLTKEIDTVALFLDPLESINKPKILPFSLYNFLIQQRYAKIVSKVNIVLLPINIKTKMKEMFYFNKLNFFEYPSLNVLDFNGIKLPFKESRNINITYAGTLDNNYRSPINFLTSMEKVNSSGTEIDINIYGKNNTNDIFSLFSELSIHLHGYSSRLSIINAYNQSDFLINIGNLETYSVPSKIFELFSTGKPIINYVKSINDYSLRYFEKYPLKFNFYEWKDFDEQVIELKEFIYENRKKTVKPEIINKLFIENTPDFLVEKIVTLVSERET